MTGFHPFSGCYTPQSTRSSAPRKWRNWQTRKPQELVPHKGVGVRIPPSAPLIRRGPDSGALIVRIRKIANGWLTNCASGEFLGGVRRWG